MNGTTAAPHSAPATGQKTQANRGPDLVLAALSVSALVTASAAYVALDYLAQPFAEVAPVATAPLVDTRGPFMAEVAQPGIAPSRLGFNDTAPDFVAAALPTAPDLGAPPPSPVRLVYGAPPVIPPQRPDGLSTEDDSLVAFAPVPRPATSAPATSLASASTFPQPGLTASLRPEERPSGFATVVASAREPANVTAISSVEVARAAAPEVEIEPARLELETLRPIRTAGNPCTSRLARGIPGRTRSAPGGSDVISALAGMGGADRDARVMAALFDGNVPDFMRNLRPVSFGGVTASGEEMVVTICVMPDYLAVGSDRDFVRVPLGLPAALRVADAFDMMLPTPRMVDAIFAQADLRLSPQPMQPGAEMTSTNYFLRHDGLVDQQMARAGGRLGLLVAGQKKDVVLANRLSANPGRVAIYGWHRASGSPIQPLSTVHGAQYADYSHGVRLVSRTAFVGGRAVDLGDLLTDARYASLLNSDGPITGRAVQMAALR